MDDDPGSFGDFLVSKCTRYFYRRCYRYNFIMCVVCQEGQAHVNFFEWKNRLSYGQLIIRKKDY